MRIEILVEETSMKALLEGLIPRLCNNEVWKLDENVFIRAFEGKSHLRKELPKKAKVYANFHEPVFLLVLHDQDSNDCRELKNKLLGNYLGTLKSYELRAQWNGVAFLFHGASRELRVKSTSLE